MTVRFGSDPTVSHSTESEIGLMQIGHDVL
jgi:hypothetical protein